MKKLILTCFLALLCLFGSETRAQSRVAESPLVSGADILHRSMPLGGGETRSTSPPGFSLVDDSNSQGQGNFGSPAGGEVVIYVETKRIQALDSLEFRVWSPYLNERDLPLAEVSQLQLSAGNMYEGSRETARGDWVGKLVSDYGRLTLRQNRFIYFDRFLVEPGDSLRVLLDFENARMLFSGPAADKFRCQYELANAYENDRYDQNPILFTQQLEYWGYSTADSLQIVETIRRESSIHRRMEFVSPGEKGLAQLEQLFTRDIYSHPGFEVLDRYRDKLDPKFLAILRADLIGRLYFDQVRSFSTYYQEDADHWEFFETYIAGKLDEIPSGAVHSSFYPEYLYQKLVIVSALRKEPFRNLLGELPEQMRDLVYGKYITQNYRRFKDSNRQFELALGQIQTPWLQEEIGRLYAAQKIGERLTSSTLTDLEGKERSLNELEGQLLLISFWLPGCQASAAGYQSLIQPVEEYFAGKDAIRFVYVSHDSNPERWNQNIDSGKYATAESLNLNAPGRDHPFLQHYNIRYFPTYMVVDAKGKVQNIGNLPNSPEQLIAYLNGLLSADSLSTFSSPNL